VVLDGSYKALLAVVGCFECFFFSLAFCSFFFCFLFFLFFFIFFLFFPFSIMKLSSLKRTNLWPKKPIYSFSPYLGFYGLRVIFIYFSSLFFSSFSPPPLPPSYSLAYSQLKLFFPSLSLSLSNSTFSLSRLIPSFLLWPSIYRQGILEYL